MHAFQSSSNLSLHCLQRKIQMCLDLCMYPGKLIQLKNSHFDFKACTKRKCKVSSVFGSGAAKAPEETDQVYDASYDDQVGEEVEGEQVKLLVETPFN